jgi:hypothetical protein
MNQRSLAIWQESQDEAKRLFIEAITKIEADKLRSIWSQTTRDVCRHCHVDLDELTMVLARTDALHEYEALRKQFMIEDKEETEDELDWLS